LLAYKRLITVGYQVQEQHNEISALLPGDTRRLAAKDRIRQVREGLASAAAEIELIASDAVKGRAREVYRALNALIEHDLDITTIDESSHVDLAKSQRSLLDAMKEDTDHRPDVASE